MKVFDTSVEPDELTPRLGKLRVRVAALEVLNGLEDLGRDLLESGIRDEFGLVAKGSLIKSKDK